MPSTACPWGAPCPVAGSLPFGAVMMCWLIPEFRAGPLLTSHHGDEPEYPAGKGLASPGSRRPKAHACLHPQRWNPVGGFCEKLLPSDRWPWSDVSGLQHRPLDGVALPSPHWEWESDWYVDENFGGEPTEKGVGELGSWRGSTWEGNALGLARPLSAGPSVLWQPTPAFALHAPHFLHRISGDQCCSSFCLLPPSSVLSLPFPRALQSAPTLYFRGGHMPWTFLPLTQGTRSGILT